MLHILYKNTKSCRGTHSRKRRGRNCCYKGKTCIWIVQGFWKKCAELEVIFNSCWVLGRAKWGVYKPKLVDYKPRVLGTGTLVHSLGAMNLSPMIPEITSNPPNRPIWFVIYPLWFVDTSFCISNTQQLLKIASISTLFFQNPCTIQINVLPLQQQFQPRLFLECVPRQDFVFL